MKQQLLNQQECFSFCIFLSVQLTQPKLLKQKNIPVQLLSSTHMWTTISGATGEWKIHGVAECQLKGMENSQQDNRVPQQRLKPG